MTKIVYNACYGGFGLSPEAMQMYADLKGLAVYPEKDTWGTVFYTDPPGTKDRKALNEWNIFRADPVLVEVVEKLGKKANGTAANLMIADVSKGDQYRIDEYDGFESVRTRDDYDWTVA